MKSTRCRGALNTMGLLMLTLEDFQHAEISRTDFACVLNDPRLSEKDERVARRVLAGKTNNFYGINWKLT